MLNQPLAILVVLCITSLSHAGMMGQQTLAVDLTDLDDASAKVTWSPPDNIAVTEAGLGWDGNAATFRDTWVQTRPLAIGWSWRPTYAARVRVSIGFSYDAVQQGQVYVRYSPDKVNWSTWQPLQPDKAYPGEENRGPSRYYVGSVRVPYRQRADYVERLMTYQRMDVPWPSDEEAAVKWILESEPDYLARRLPFVGYVQCLYETSLPGVQRIKSIHVDANYAVGGRHLPPKDDVAAHEGVWRFEQEPAKED